jgi:hypothetical protein
VLPPPQPPRPLLLEPPLLEPPPHLPPRPLLLPLPPLFFLLDFLLLLEQPRPPATCSISSRVKTRMLNSWLLKKLLPAIGLNCELTSGASYYVVSLLQPATCCNDCSIGKFINRN